MSCLRSGRDLVELQQPVGLRLRSRRLLGWAVFNSDGTADGEVTGCGHGGGLNGAIHFHADGDGWYVQNGTFWIANETDTYVGRFAHVETSTNTDTGIPAAPGHYSTTDILGFSAPGVSFNIQVVKIPNR